MVLNRFVPFTFFVNNKANRKANTTDFSDEVLFKEMSNNNRITHVMIKDAQKYRSLDRYFKDSKKFYIKLDDLFDKQKRNEDYLGISAHKFSEEHLYYRSEGYDGFSDFTGTLLSFIKK